MSSAGAFSAEPALGARRAAPDASAPAAPAAPAAPGKRRPSAGAIAVLAALAVAHTPLPWGLAWLGHHGGIQAVELAALGLHFFGPLLYLPVYRRVRLSGLEWALVLAINHAFVLIGAAPYLL